MAIRYVDLVNGNDANNGTTFALRKKTLSSASSGLSSGDTVRIMKSSDPTSLGSCTWAANSTTITLPSVATSHICKGISTTTFTGSTNVTVSYPTSALDAKLSGSAVQLAIAAGFTTGKIAYHALSGMSNFSSYQQISLSFRNSAAITANNIYLNLCSDTTGDTVLAAFPIPAMPANSSFSIPLTLTLGSNLPSGVQSISFSAVADPGTVNLIFTNILACKASTEATSLTLNSIIGLNTTDEPEWYAIRSIDDTLVKLETQYNWVGSTGSLTTYKLQPITAFEAGALATSAYSSSGHSSWTVTGGNGTTGTGLINFEFGWDTTDMSTQNGVTAFDFEIGSGGGIRGDYIWFDKFISVRSYSYFDVSGTLSSFIDFGTFHSVAPGVVGMITSSNNSAIIRGDKFYATCIPSTLSGQSCGAVYLNDTSFKYTRNSNTGPVLTVTGTISTFIKNFTLIGFRGLNFTNSYDTCIDNLTLNPSDNTTTSALNGTNSKVRIKTLTIGSGVIEYIWKPSASNCIFSIGSIIGTPMLGEIFPSTSTANTKIFIGNYNSTGVSKSYTEYGMLQSESSVVRTAGGISWRANTTAWTNFKSTVDTQYYKVHNWKIADIPVKANKLVTVSIYARRLYTTSKGALFIKPGINGVTNYVVAETVGSANTWEQLSITFTPTTNGVAELFISPQYDVVNAGQYIYFDDLSVTIAD